MGSYLRPLELQDALAALAAQPLTVIAGGTDFYPARVGQGSHEDLLDVTRVACLRGIVEDSVAWRVGAATTWSDLIRGPLPDYFQTLKLAAREVGGVQIQNAGTLGGNICNASPAADGVPPLIALGADVELSSAAGRRQVKLEDFVLGNRKTQRLANELVTAIIIPKWQPGARSTFRKLGARKYLLISIVMVAACVETDGDGTITRAGISVGACSPVARRLLTLEQKLIGKPLSPAIANWAQPSDLQQLTPIADVRSSAEFRLEAALTLVRRALRELAGE